MKKSKLTEALSGEAPLPAIEKLYNYVKGLDDKLEKDIRLEWARILFADRDNVDITPHQINELLKRLPEDGNALLETGWQLLTVIPAKQDKLGAIIRPRYVHPVGTMFKTKQDLLDHIAYTATSGKIQYLIVESYTTL